MRKIIFDIETKNLFSDVGAYDPALLDLAIVAIYDSATDTYSSYLESELPKLWPIIEHADVLVGFNSDHFDIPLLNKYYPGDLTAIRSLDLLAEIKKSCGRRMKLDQLAEGTLGAKKSGQGAEATIWWKRGEIDKVREYCVNDVRLTKELYDFALVNNKLMYKEGGQSNTVNLDTSAWEEKGNHKLTFSLPF